jgi:transposase
MGRRSKYSPELRVRVMRMVQEHTPDYLSQGAAIRSVAEKLGCSVEALQQEFGDPDVGSRIF